MLMLVLVLALLCLWNLVLVALIVAMWVSRDALREDSLEEAYELLCSMADHPAGRGRAKRRPQDRL